MNAEETLRLECLKLACVTADRFPRLQVQDIADMYVTYVVKNEWPKIEQNGTDTGNDNGSGHLPSETTGEEKPSGEEAGGFLFGS